jgi:alkylresorcinol/alkylpyrone synthase
MPRVAAVSNAVPDHVLEQSDVRAFAATVFPKDLYERLLPVFDNANIDRRYFAIDPNWLLEGHTFTEVNDRYIEIALKLSEQVVSAAANQASINTDQIDAIFFVSTTGLSTPSIDARLFNRMSLSPHIRRVPIWGLGCAGGASAFALAADYLRAHPAHRAIVVALELCSLAFQPAEASKSNIISAALFGDGAAACILEGDDVRFTPRAWSQPNVLGSLSTIYPDSLDVMGWRITSEGFKVVLSRDIPSIVTGLVKPNIDELVKREGIDVRDIKHFVAHPGGTKVLGAYEEALRLPSSTFNNSRSILREFGNMSSATVYFILKCFLEQVPQGSGEYGLLSALGPGFSSELVLLQW